MKFQGVETQTHSCFPKLSLFSWIKKSQHFFLKKVGVLLWFDEKLFEGPELQSRGSFETHTLLKRSTSLQVPPREICAKVLKYSQSYDFFNVDEINSSSGMQYLMKFDEI